MTKVLILSDLHLDHSNFTPDTDGAEIIILAGDIAGRNNLLDEFFYRKIPQGVPTIFVPGNHEYEHHDFAEKNAFMQNLCDEFGIHFLYNKEVMIDNIRFIGSPLFSNLKGFYSMYFPDSDRAKTPDPKLVEWVQDNISDFKYIFHKDSLGGEGRWTVADMLAEFDKGYAFIKNALEKPTEARKTVVVTHFSPTFHFAKLGEDALYSSYWCNHIPELYGKADYWINGHTHTPHIRQEGTTKLVVNPRGYNSMVDLPENANFQKKLLLEI